MGILPTDSYPALVCDVDARKAVERLYQAKEMSPSKQLSILCKSFSDIQTYTLGFPTTSSGQDTFRIAKRVLPGPVSPPYLSLAMRNFGLTMFTCRGYSPHVYEGTAARSAHRCLCQRLLCY